MKTFYIFTLLIGFYLAFIMMLVSFVLPTDAFIASALSSSPEGWSLEINEDFNRDSKI